MTVFLDTLYQLKLVRLCLNFICLRCEYSSLKWKVKISQSIVSIVECVLLQQMFLYKQIFLLPFWELLKILFFLTRMHKTIFKLAKILHTVDIFLHLSSFFQQTVILRWSRLIFAIWWPVSRIIQTFHATAPSPGRRQ